MRLKTFSAKNMNEALASVRAEMGPEAIIISSHRGKNGGLFVRAAVEDSVAEAKAESAAAVLREAETQSETVPAQSFEQSFQDGLVRRIRGEAPAPKPKPLNFNRAELLKVLHTHRTPEGLAHVLAENAEKSRLTDMTLALASALDLRMPTSSLFAAAQSTLMLSGPNGVGKTAVAAKIAAHARLAGRDVTLIASDTDGAGAVARLETFANHLDAKIVIAESAETLAKTIVAERATKNTVIVDTAGFDPRDGKARTAFSALTKIEGVETIAVVSAMSDAEEVSETVSALKSAGAQRLIVTCADLARRMGALLSAATRGLPLAHVTRSPFVAGGLETLTPLSLARLLLQSTNPDRGSPL
jgi:flagellar biosynthesis protein FlhF